MVEDKTTLVDAQAQVEGKLSGKDAAVHGRVKGEIALTGRLLIGEEGRVHASVAADSVEVAGQLEGDVRARAVTLRETARVKGRVEARALVVREGAWLSGPVASGEPPARDKGTPTAVVAAKSAEGPAPPEGPKPPEPPKPPEKPGA
jgi:cytoskeletal protein CcmA (bactofilin family)